MKLQKKQVVTGRLLLLTLSLTLVIFALAFPQLSQAAGTAEEINKDVNNALLNLYRTTPAAKNLSKVAQRDSGLPACH